MKHWINRNSNMNNQNRKRKCQKEKKLKNNWKESNLYKFKELVI